MTELSTTTPNLWSYSRSDSSTGIPVLTQGTVGGAQQALRPVARATAVCMGSVTWILGARLQLRGVLLGCASPSLRKQKLAPKVAPASYAPRWPRQAGQPVDSLAPWRSVQAAGRAEHVPSVPEMMSIFGITPSRSPIPPPRAPYSPTAWTSSTKVIAPNSWATSHSSSSGHTAPAGTQTTLRAWRLRLLSW